MILAVIGVSYASVGVYFGTGGTGMGGGGSGDIETVGTCTTGACTDDFIDGTDMVDDAIDDDHLDYDNITVPVGSIAIASNYTVVTATVSDGGYYTPTSGYGFIYAQITCDSDGASYTLGEDSPSDGSLLVITNVGANTCVMYDDSTIQELPAKIEMEQHNTATFAYSSDRWVYSGGGQDTVYFSSIELPNVSTGDVAVTEGQVQQKSHEDALAFHFGSTGEIQDEALVSGLDHLVWAGDPGAAYDEDTEIFLLTVGDDYPSGMMIVEWKVSCDVDPDVEIDADLRYADAWIGLASAADIDEIDTTNGVASEDTNANINSGTAVANAKVVYIGFDADPEGTCSQMIFEMWMYAVED
jgi:hypothetical protein